MTRARLKIVLTPAEVEARTHRPLEVVLTPRKVAEIVIANRARIRNERRAATYRGRA